MKTLLFISLFLLSIAGNILAQNNAQINNSFIAFTIAEKDLLPENIAYDTQTESYFVGSTRKGKILKVTNGLVEDFISPRKYGLWMTIGMKADIQRRVLWVCSSGGSNLEGYTHSDEKEGRPAGVFKFDLDSGALIKKYTLEEEGEVHFFNDLVVARNGDVYVTHMFGESAIYKIGNKSDELELFVRHDSISYPNGITLADNQSILFVAHANGLSRIDIPDKKVRNLDVPENVKVARRESIDGLYYYKWSLIGVQADLKSVNRYFLKEAGDGIEKVEVLERNHPMMDHPTTGVLVDDTFYYVANSKFERISESGELFPMSQLYEPTILKIKLSR